MTAPAIDLDALLRRLHLPTVRRLYADLAQRAEQDGLSYRDCLAFLIAEEVAHRAQTRIQRGVRRAHFPFLTTIEITGQNFWNPHQLLQTESSRPWASCWRAWPTS